MNFSEREVLLRSWDRLESPSIVIDAVTKGKHIQLAIAFLSQRLQQTHDETKVYINSEIDGYVQRLLVNGQIFRAEHVLLNLGRKPKYIFYEFMVNHAKDPPPQIAANSSTPKTEDSILNYLTKAEWDFPLERKELDVMLKVLETIQTTPQLQEKYVNLLTKFNLEKAYEQSDEFRADMAADVLFIAKKTFVGPLLRRREVWRYILEHCQRDVLIIWLQALSTTDFQDLDNSNCNIDVAEDNDENDFETQLTQIFSRWAIDTDMMSKLEPPNMADLLSESVRNALAMVGLFLQGDQLIDKLRRVFATESWLVNADLLNSPETAAQLIALIVANNWFPLLFRISFDGRALEAAAAAASSERDKSAIELCLAMQRFDAPSAVDLAEECGRYFVRNDPEYFVKNCQLYFVELLLRSPSIESIRSDEKFAKMLPILPNSVQTIFRRHFNVTNRLDYTASLVSLVKQFMRVDLRELQSEADGAGEERWSFSSASLIAQFGATERLGWLYYVKQHRSAYAVFVFFVEHLSQYSRITQGKKIYILVKIIVLDGKKKPIFTNGI